MFQRILELFQRLLEPDLIGALRATLAATPGGQCAIASRIAGIPGRRDIVFHLVLTAGRPVIKQLYWGEQSTPSMIEIGHHARAAEAGALLAELETLGIWRLDDLPRGKVECLEFSVAIVRGPDARLVRAYSDSPPKSPQRRASERARAFFYAHYPRLPDEVWDQPL